jgi:hypothetical protein
MDLKKSESVFGRTNVHGMVIYYVNMKRLFLCYYGCHL